MINKKLTNYFLYFALLNTLLFYSADIAYSRSISDSIKTAVSSSPDVIASYASEIGKKSEVQEKRSAFYPVFGVEASFERMKTTDFNTRARTTSGSDTGYGGDANFKLSQMVFDGNGSLNSYKATQSRLKASKYDLQKKASDIAMKAVMAHLNFLHMQELEFITNEYLSDLQKYDDKLQLLVDEGAADMSELLQAREVKAITNNRLLDYKEKKNIAEAEYLQIVGKMPDDEMTIAKEDILAGKLVPTDIKEALEIAKNKQAILYAAGYTLEALDYEVKAENSVKYPRLDAEISHYRRDQRDSFGGEVEDSSAMLKMRWNFEIGGGQKARIAKRKQDREEARYRKLSIERELEKQLRQSIAKYNIAIDRIRLNTERKKTNLDIFENYKNQFEGGKRSVLELVNMRNQLYRAETEYLNAYYNYYATQFSLLNVAGMLEDAFGMDFSKLVIAN